MCCVILFLEKLLAKENPHICLLGTLDLSMVHPHSHNTIDNISHVIYHHSLSVHCVFPDINLYFSSIFQTDLITCICNPQPLIPLMNILHVNIHFEVNISAHIANKDSLTIPFPMLMSTNEVQFP